MTSHESQAEGEGRAQGGLEESPFLGREESEADAAAEAAVPEPESPFLESPEPSAELEAEPGSGEAIEEFEEIDREESEESYAPVDSAEEEETISEEESDTEVESEVEEFEVELSEEAGSVTFPSGEKLTIVSGATGPGEEHHDPANPSNPLPLLDTSGDQRSKRLSTNFTVHELTKSGGRTFDVARIDPKLVQCLQAIRDRAGKSVTVTSGYRSYRYNLEIYRRRGRKPTRSQHSSGKAADIAISGMSGVQIAKLAIDSCGTSIAIGLGARFAHVDVRGRFTVWNYGGVAQRDIDEVRRYRNRSAQSGSQEFEGESGESHATGEFGKLDREVGHEEQIWDSEESAENRDAELLAEEIAASLPRRVVPPASERELIVNEAPPPPKGVHAFDHWVTPMKRDAATNSWIPDGAERKLEPLDPGFLDARGELKTGALHDSLKQLLAGNPEFRPRAGGTLRVALVDLTGSKLLNPEFAGSGSTVPVNGASCPKIAPLYAAFQLRNDLKHVAIAEKIKTTAELVRVMTDRWKGIADAPKLDRLFYRLTDPPALEFTSEVDGAIHDIVDQHRANRAAKLLIDLVGFPYIASLLWQSGLRHPTRGGLWLTTSYAGGAAWRNPSRPPPAPVFGHNVTALSLATFFTLLAQGRLAPSGLPRTIKTVLSNTSWFTVTLPSATTASKVGLLKKCLRFGPKMEGGKPVIVNGKPVQECKDSIDTHVHEAALIENEGFRYAVAIMTTGIPTGYSLLLKLIGELDGLIRRNNP